MTTKIKERSFYITISSLSTLAVFIPVTSMIKFEARGLFTHERTNISLLIEIIIIVSLLVVYTLYTYGKKMKMNTHASSFNSVYNYEEIRKQHDAKTHMMNKQKLQLVIAYTRMVLSPYLKEEEVIIVEHNIEKWMTTDHHQIESVTTDGRLGTIDIRHYVWNIGERFNWTGEKRATFAKLVFPIEMRDCEIQTIRRNLRQQGTCMIDIDMPAKGRFDFTCICNDSKQE